MADGGAKRRALSALRELLRANDLVGKCSKKFIIIESIFRTSLFLTLYFGLISYFQWTVHNDAHGSTYNFFGIITNPELFWNNTKEEFAPGTLSGLVVSTLFTVAHFLLAVIILVLGPVLVVLFYTIVSFGLALIPLAIIGGAFVWILAVSQTITERMLGYVIGELTSLYMLTVLLSIISAAVYGVFYLGLQVKVYS